MATVTKKQPTKAKRTKAPMSSAHKAALAAGREEGRVVRSYLEALEQSKPRRGRKRTPDTIKKRMAVIDGELEVAEPLHRLHLVQEQLDLEDELSTEIDTVDLAGLEKGFTKVAAAYGTRKGLSYSAWRTVGVSAPVLKKAGIARTRA